MTTREDRRQFDSLRRRLGRAERHLTASAPRAPDVRPEDFGIEEGEQRFAEVERRVAVVDAFLAMEQDTRD